ncbi:MAG: potassium channel protein [Candidatus Marinimicrobia bacterium]|jgi:voltage-gated potassium channel|nr:potassium channel protein [Candidatus Neomarinimicrobiota bacterium]MBT3633728.1 potassium channel protein [Candidatus Neomarinimicrobiota bacterium]MBT3682520.1 potassium channel protein [Candidatus Neomarinimicrobiota bacterium]MBT3759284.1 potassium channel protein [Candidatus Neomarinimicrobiota bacterium]MBT3894708.1 potassium channel protein [Candidatus Neomarinimicrobiota bacterium]
MDFTHKLQLLRKWSAIPVFYLVGTIGYRTIEDMSWTDSLYMTSVVLSTVGYGGGIEDLSASGRLFTVFLIIFGVGIVAYAITVTADYLIQNQYFGRMKMERKIKNLRNHYVVCGFGRMGRIICNELNKNDKKFVVIEKNDIKVEEAKAQGYLTIWGDSLDDETLRKCRLDRSRGLVAVLSTDENNLFVTLSARGLNKDLYIIAKSSQTRNMNKYITAGANKVLNPYDIAGHSLANMLTRPTGMDFLEVIGKGSEVDWEMDEITIKSGSVIVGKQLNEFIFSENMDIIIVATKKPEGDLIFNPPKDTLIEEGDLLIAMGYLANLRSLENCCTNEPQVD